MIDKSLGEDGEPRPFIDASGVWAVAKVMTDQWVTTQSDVGPEHGPDMKRSCVLHRDDRYDWHSCWPRGQARADR